MKQTILALLLGNLALISDVYAIEFNHIVADSSTVGFVYQQMGVPMQGSLKKFDAQLIFDPAKLSAAKAVFDINVSSMDAGSQEANDELSKKEWFDTQAFPQAKFVSTEIKALGGNRYEVSGKMTIKGRAKDITANFTFAPQNNIAIFDGNFSVNRADFAIGTGEWADVGVIANEIQIKFHFVAEAGK